LVDEQYPLPSQAELETARSAFYENELRDLFYRAANYLVSQAFDGDSPLTVGEAIGVLLQTWNQAYYRYHKPSKRHLDDLEALIAKYQVRLLRWRNTSICGLTDESGVPEVFEDFERLLGPVGASKALHLLCPKLFPLWDRAITKAYRVWLGPTGTNGKCYADFMAVCRNQVTNLYPTGSAPDDILKQLDEYNYCRFDTYRPGEKSAEERKSALDMLADFAIFCSSVAWTLP
jgi:hypothetical protein